jgi:predicted kinase
VRRPGALWLRSDLERKAMFGVEETVHLPASAYASDLTRDVYRRLMDKARIALRAGQAVVLDATFASAAERRAAGEVAAEVSAAFSGLFLDAPLSTRLERIASRRADASDADVDVARRQRRLTLYLGYVPDPSGPGHQQVARVSVATRHGSAQLARRNPHAIRRPDPPSRRHDCHTRRRGAGTTGHLHHRFHDALLVATAQIHGHGLVTRRDQTFGPWTKVPIATV